jgi:hypothetical protein
MITAAAKYDCSCIGFAVNFEAFLDEGRVEYFTAVIEKG